MVQISWRHLTAYITLSISVVILGILFLFQYDTVYELREREAMLLEERNFFLNEHASTTKQLEAERALASSTITELASRLSLSGEELSKLERQLRREQEINDEFEEQIQEISGTVATLDKLSKTDEELLQKYSRTYFLNEHFMPLKLSQIPSEYILPGKKDQYFHGDAIPFLLTMLDDAQEDGHDIKIISAFRSFDEQNELKDQFTQQYGTGANTFSADQGFSEHQLGTAVDIVDTATGVTSQSFANTEAYAWLTNNAHHYGFILSYPLGNDYYIFEPWHWRFVGRDLAEDLHEDKTSFYDLDQRTLDTYLVKIFD